MESHDKFNDLRLSEVDFLTQEQLEIFESYNIFTLGHLLGATKGFTKTLIIDELDSTDDLLDRFLGIVPDEILEQYQSYSKNYPTGLLKTSDNENKEENIDK